MSFAADLEERQARLRQVCSIIREDWTDWERHIGLLASENGASIIDVYDDVLHTLSAGVVQEINRSVMITRESLIAMAVRCAAQLQSVTDTQRRCNESLTELGITLRRFATSGNLQRAKPWVPPTVRDQRRRRHR